MVMKRNAMRKNLRQSIVKSLGRYIAIVAIIALGASMFVGLRMTKADMVATGQKYTDEQNMFDLRLVSAFGWGQEQLDALKKMASEAGLSDIEGLFYTDLIAHQGDAAEEAVYRFYTLPETVNRLVLVGGRMPENPEECLADGYHADDSILGTKVILSQSNEEDALDIVTETEFTIVGYVSTPLYMDMNRGTTSVGSGSIANYFFVPQETFDVDYYTEIHVTFPGEYAIYSDEYNDALDAMAEKLEPMVAPLAQERFEQVLKDAKEAYADGMEEYRDGMQEFREGKAEANRELQDAKQQLLDAEKELEDNEKLLIEGRDQLEEGKKTLEESEVTLAKSRAAYESGKAAAYKQLNDSNLELMTSFQELSDEKEVLDAQALQLTTDLLEVNGAITEKELELAAIDGKIAQAEAMISLTDASIQSAQAMLELLQSTGFVDTQRLAEIQAEIDEQNILRDGYVSEWNALNAQRAEFMPQLDPLYARRAELEAQQAALEAEQSAQAEAIATIAEGLLQITVMQSQMDNQFAAAEAQLKAGEAQLEAGKAELELREQELADGLALLEEGKQELADGWKEYEEGKAEAEQEIADAEAELADARQKLADAKESIDNMTEGSLHILDRNTNVGYASLDSSSDIVAGVSKVFPAFFLLVAALVCITTMTRMVDEERTQIGTLKALGYSNGAIISKYMLYAGSSALVGCGLGVLLGSVIFPMILWEAYKIMLFISPTIVLTFDWGLCLAVVGAYTAVMLLVTWYCCHKTLGEVPAELIRPKAPAAGKQLMFEKLPFWHKISFLNKVTIRNIFRYRQRLAMMMVGIGGCTALLLTGFGLRDSIVNIVDFQFEDITTYDMEVYFSEAQTEDDMEIFRKEMEPYVTDLMFYHQTSVEIDFDNQTREIYMISASEDIHRFIDLHSGNKSLELPGRDEMLLSVGVAEALGVDIGDRVLLRNADMDVLDLTVSGIYYNHVYNYAIVAPQTIEGQWGTEPELQMAFIKVQDDRDPHEVTAEISSMDHVMNVSVSEDLADMVRSMMDALDLVVIVVVVCAGLLAAIVLYNLTNININERIREIATIKVLGFNAMETAMYIFKENLSLSVFGAFAGLFLGKLLLEFVMSEIKINMVWFLARALPMSYILSVVMTILMAVIVDFIFYFKLERINMAEALKSVE